MLLAFFAGVAVTLLVVGVVISCVDHVRDRESRLSSVASIEPFDFRGAIVTDEPPDPSEGPSGLLPPSGSPRHSPHAQRVLTALARDC